MTIYVVIMAIAVAVTIAGEFTQIWAMRAAGKVVAATTFVVAAVALGVPGRSPHGAAILAAMVLSWIGDVALLSDHKKVFLVGLGSFLLAHVAFAIAFLSLGPTPLAVALALVMLSPSLFLVLRWIGPRAGKLTVPVRLYMVAITAMVALAVGIVGTNMGPVWVLAAHLFFFSDLFVARQRFISPTPYNRLVGLPPYFAAQLLFVYAAAHS
jgi:uncharacterized membrane protein YhhN